MPAQIGQIVVIANGETASSAFDLGQGVRGSFTMPAAMTGVATTVKVSNDGTNWTNCPVEGNEANPITTAANGNYSLPVKAFNFRFIQLVSGSAEGAERTITVFLRGG